MDEPPIRVKGGSINMDMIHHRKQWRKHNDNPQHWKPSSGKRGKNKYLVYLAPTLGNHARCPKGFVISGNIVKFTHTNPITHVDVVVTFESTGKKTSVTCGVDLDTPTPSNRRLQYTDTEQTTYISLIKIDGKKVGEFTDRSQLDSVLITEEPDEP